MTTRQLVRTLEREVSSDSPRSIMVILAVSARDDGIDRRAWLSRTEDAYSCLSLFCRLSSVVERLHGKQKVIGSIPIGGSDFVL